MLYLFSWPAAPSKCPNSSCSTLNGSEFDEDKIIIGCLSLQDAKALYMSHCHSEKCFGGIKEFTIDEFRKILDHYDN